MADLARLRGGDIAAVVGSSLVIERSHDLLSALLIGNLLVNTAAGVVTTAICLDWFGARGVAVAIPVATIALLLVGEITPKMLALRFREPVARAAQAPLRLWLWLIPSGDRGDHLGDGIAPARPALRPLGYTGR